MRHLLTVTTLAATLMAGSAFAQTTQAGILGASGDSVYSLRVQGANGVVYNCKDEIVNINGAASRECVREGNDGALFDAGSGLGVGAAAGGVALVLLAVAGGSDNAATTTTGSGS